MRGIAFIGGEGPAPEILKELAAGADFLIAADSGLIAMEEAGISPHWIVGDMDSLGDMSRISLLEKYPPGIIQISPPEKDLTDTEIAINMLKEKGCDEIWLAGGGGGRIDHLFALRSLFEREHAPARWYTAREEIITIEEGTTFQKTMANGCMVSVFPLGSGPWAAESEGLKWPLNGLGWTRGAYGISNVTTDASFLIRSVRGRFMVIAPVDAASFGK